MSDPRPYSAESLSETAAAQVVEKLTNPLVEMRHEVYAFEPENSGRYDLMKLCEWADSHLDKAIEDIRRLNDLFLHNVNTQNDVGAQVQLSKMVDAQHQAADDVITRFEARGVEIKAPELYPIKKERSQVRRHAKRHQSSERNRSQRDSMMSEDLSYLHETSANTPTPMGDGKTMPINNDMSMTQSMGDSSDSWARQKHPGHNAYQMPNGQLVYATNTPAGGAIVQQPHMIAPLAGHHAEQQAPIQTNQSAQLTTPTEQAIGQSPMPEEQIIVIEEEDSSGSEDEEDSKRSKSCTIL